jgi:cytochrome c oxidase assembly factor CtaG
MRRAASIIALVAVAAGVSAAPAHGIDQHEAAWTFDPWIVTPLVFFGVLYVAGLVRLWHRGRHVSRLSWRILVGAAGWLSLAGALLSPLHELGERLFTFHMIEHEIVMAISAPLLVAARPFAMVLWGLPAGLRRRAVPATASSALRAIWRWLTEGTHATVLHAIAIWGWHVPSLFDAAVSNVTLHRLQHLSFFVTAVWFWWSVFWRSGRGVATWHLFATMMHTAVLGALMALAPRVLYTVQTQAAAMWGMTPLDDQQLAGIVMWIPAGTIYAGAALVMAALWISQSSRTIPVVGHARP